MSLHVHLVYLLSNSSCADHLFLVYFTGTNSCGAVTSFVFGKYSIEIFAMKWL
jgi:hypothetical protein